MPHDSRGLLRGVCVSVRGAIVILLISFGETCITLPHSNDARQGSGRLLFRAAAPPCTAPLHDCSKFWASQSLDLDPGPEIPPTWCCWKERREAWPRHSCPIHTLLRRIRVVAVKRMSNADNLNIATVSTPAETLLSRGLADGPKFIASIAERLG